MKVNAINTYNDELKNEINNLIDLLLTKAECSEEGMLVVQYILIQHIIELKAQIDNFGELIDEQRNKI